MEIVNTSILIFESDEPLDIIIIKMNYAVLYLKPEKPRKEEENLIHDLYLEDFLDSDEY